MLFNWTGCPSAKRLKSKITDWECFTQFAAQHGDKTQVQLAELWDGDISRRTIAHGLNTIGWTRKKNPTDTVNAMKTNEVHSLQN